MLFLSLAVIAALARGVLGCPQHSNNKQSHLQGRQNNPAEKSNTTQPIWAYEVRMPLDANLT
jgi:carbonic anhydrase